MPWIPTVGALRRWRDFQKLTVPELVKRTRSRGKPQVSERTIRMLESAKPQPSVQDSNVRALAKALSFNGLVCLPEYLARWRYADGSFAREPATPDPTLTGAAAALVVTSGEIVAPRRTRKLAENAADDVEPTATALDAQRRLTTMAEIERAIGKHALRIELPSGSYPVVGCDWLHELATQYAEYADQTFAIAGAVLDGRPIPARAVEILNAEAGRGAAYFKVGRVAAGLDDNGRAHRVEVYPTVFAPRGEHGKVLMRAHKEKRPVTVLARIVIAERKVGPTRDATWDGFYWFEKGRSSGKPYCFVCEEIIVGDIIAPPAHVGEKLPPLLAPGGLPIE